jgi:hypothetical protein
MAMSFSHWHIDCFVGLVPLTTWLPLARSALSRTEEREIGFLRGAETRTELCFTLEHYIVAETNTEQDWTASTNYRKAI